MSKIATVVKMVFIYQDVEYNTEAEALDAKLMDEADNILCSYQEKFDSDTNEFLAAHGKQLFNLLKENGYGD